MRMFLVAIGLVLALGVPLSAEKIDKSQVAADAKWLVQVDLDAARDSTVGEKFRAAMLENDKAKRRLDTTGKALGISFAKDIHGMLLYDRRFVQGRGVAIIRADADAQRLTAFVEKLPDYKKTESDGRQFHTFTHKKRMPSGHPVTACFHDKGIVLGRDASDVIAAVKVLDGKSADLGNSDSPLGDEFAEGRSLPPGTIVQIRATDLGDDDVPFKSPIIRQSKALSIIAGELEGEAFARVRMVAASEEVAQQIKAAVEGYLAVALLQSGDNEKAKNLFRAAKVGVDGDVVTIRWKGRAEDMLRFVEKRMKRRGDGDNGKKRGSRPNSRDRK